MKNGVCKNSDIFYIFIIVGNTYSVQFPEQSNIKIIPRENIGYDFSSWKIALESIDINNYDRFIFMNDTVCGPIYLDMFQKILPGILCFVPYLLIK